MKGLVFPDRKNVNEEELNDGVEVSAFAHFSNNKYRRETSYGRIYRGVCSRDS